MIEVKYFEVQNSNYILLMLKTILYFFFAIERYKQKFCY